MPSVTRKIRVSCSLELHSNCPAGSEWTCECECHAKIIQPEFSVKKFHQNVHEFIYETWRSMQRVPNADRKFHFDEVQPALFHGFEELCTRSDRIMTMEEGIAFMDSLEWIVLQSDYSTDTNERLMRANGLELR
jgi:hypothetical protein